MKRRPKWLTMLIHCDVAEADTDADDDDGNAGIMFLWYNIMITWEKNSVYCI